MKKEDIRTVIDAIYDAVNESKMGPFNLNRNAVPTFNICLQNMIPNNILQDMKQEIVEPKEPWQAQQEDDCDE